MTAKNLVGVLALATLFGGASAHALESKLATQVDQINSMDKAGQFQQAYEQVGKLVDALHSDLKVGQTVVELNERMTEIRNETITESFSSDESENYSASLWSLLAEGDGSSSSSHHLNYDTTKIITQNPEETAEFAARHGGSAVPSIKSALNNYVTSKAEEMVLLKEAGQKALELATKLKLAGKPVPDAQIKRILRAVTQLHFVGSKQITTCVQTNYANRARDESSDSHEEASASVFFLFSASYSHDSHSEEHWRQYAHSVKTCDSNIQSAEFSVKDLAYNINLSAEDDMLWQWTRAYFAATVWDFDNQPYYPTFNNPMFRNP